ncbi:MAG TPA: nuclear transport factor 2 family protein [Gemmatimonas sp.]|uniref:nuclear transport factor 2 family protein n=1 Tax=Gemmatimonas sp. TaxID=1962908 RepID=UPI002ED7F7A8
MSDNNTAGDMLHGVLVGTPDPEIVLLEARLRAAQLTGDVATLDTLIAEELLFAGPDGQLVTKAQDLAAHAGGMVRFLAHDPIELQVRRVGPDVAVVSLRTALVVFAGGGEVRGTYRYTRVWARHDSRDWQIVAGHVSAA